MKISIITVCYNAASTIEETILSVIQQVEIEIEYIVIDGNSTDNTCDIIEKYTQQISQWVSEPDAGLYDAMNKGIARATGDFIGFLNADDYFAGPTVLRDLIEKAGSHTDCLVANTLILRDQQDPAPLRYYKGESFRPWQFRFGHQPPHPSTLVRRTTLLKAGNFDTRFAIAADYDLLLRLWHLPKMEWAGVALTLVVMRTGGVSSAGLATNAKLNREIAQSCGQNGLKTHPVLIWSKYALKLFQFIIRPKSLPDYGWALKRGRQNPGK